MWRNVWSWIGCVLGVLAVGVVLILGLLG